VNPRPAAAAAAVVSVLAGIAAGLGVFARGSGEYMAVTSARGETYEMAVDGIYAYSSKALVAEGVGWDVFTLLVAVPALALTIPAVARGSFRGLLVAGGLFGYFVYMYLEYAVTWAFGPAFVLHVAVLAVAVLGLVATSSAIADDGVSDRFDGRFPRRAFASLNLAMAALLVLLWSARIAEGLATETPDLAGEVTMTVQALDLGLVVPVTALLAIAVLRRRDAGQVAAAAFSITFLAMSAAIASMMISAWIVTGEPAIPPIVTFGLAALAGTLVAVRIFGSLRGAGHAAQAQPAATPMVAR
jgi:uncharacterized membrane protein YhaH (DUF805 family)